MYCLEASNGFRQAGSCAYSSVDHLGSYSSRDSSGQLWSLYLACEWISCRAKCYCRIADCVLPDKRLYYYGDRVLSDPPRWSWAEAFIVHAFCTLAYIVTESAWFLIAFSMSLHRGLLGSASCCCCTRCAPCSCACCFACSLACCGGCGG
jgi:hypothetical protein